MWAGMRAGTKCLSTMVSRVNLIARAVGNPWKTSNGDVTRSDLDF